MGHAPGPSPERWPIGATVGHTACQRVFWLCDFAGEPDAETTPFTYALYYRPGDDDLDHPLGADELVDALDSSFRIVENCLDRWTVEMLADELRREDYGEDWVHTRGPVIQRVFSHDVYHCGELSQTLGIAGLPQINLGLRTCVTSMRHRASMRSLADEVLRRNTHPLVRCRLRPVRFPARRARRQGLRPW